MFNSLWPHGLYSPWHSPGQNTGVGSCSLLQGIFPAQGSNPDLPHHRQILYQLSSQGSPTSLYNLYLFTPFRWSMFPFVKILGNVLHCSKVKKRIESFLFPLPSQQPSHPGNKSYRLFKPSWQLWIHPFFTDTSLSHSTHFSPSAVGVWRWQERKWTLSCLICEVPQNSVFLFTPKSFKYLTILFSSSNLSLFQMQHLHSFNYFHCDKFPDSNILTISSVFALIWSHGS